MPPGRMRLQQQPFGQQWVFRLQLNAYRQQLGRLGISLEVVVGGRICFLNDSIFEECQW